MLPTELQAIQKIITKSLIRPRDLQTDLGRDEIANLVFEQQGIRKAIQVIQNIIDGKYDLKQMEDE